MHVQPFPLQHPPHTPNAASLSCWPASDVSPPWGGPPRFPPVTPPGSAPLTLATVIAPEILKWHFDDGRLRKGQGAGADGFRPRDFSESEAWDICRSLADEIHRGAWVPQAPREHTRPKPDGTDRIIQIRNIFDRVVSAAVAQATASLIKPYLPRYVASMHGGVHQVLLLIERLAAELGRYVIALDDIRKAFDSVPVADCVQDFARYITDLRLLGLVEKILVGHRSQQSQLIGIAQGDALSSPAMDLRLHHVLDQPEQSGQRVVPLPVRFVDNLYQIGDSVSSVTEALAEDERYLNLAHLELKHSDGPPRDIREAPLDLLGFRVTAIQNEIQFELVPNAFDGLRQNLVAAHQRPEPRDSARQKIQGWISSLGPAWRNTDTSKVTSHIRWTASQAGFAGILSNQEIRLAISQSASRWTQKSQAASLTKLLGVP